MPAGEGWLVLAGSAAQAHDRRAVAGTDAIAQLDACHSGLLDVLRVHRYRPAALRANTTLCRRRPPPDGPNARPHVLPKYSHKTQPPDIRPMAPAGSMLPSVIRLGRPHGLHPPIGAPAPRL
jgi:hypothetical protein